MQTFHTNKHAKQAREHYELSEKAEQKQNITLKMLCVCEWVCWKSDKYFGWRQMEVWCKYGMRTAAVAIAEEEENSAWTHIKRGVSCVYSVFCDFHIQTFIFITCHPVHIKSANAGIS